MDAGPLLSRAGGQLALAVDARLDNRTELACALGLADRPEQDTATSELILAAYQRWGETCPEHLVGDFCFAVWDGKRQRLFCARDHMGVRPLYVFCSSRLVAFASELKALLALRDVPRRLNEQRVADFLVGDFEDTRATFYRDIWRLPAGHTLRVSAADQCVRRYWQLDPTRVLDGYTQEEFACAWRETFTEAVACRLPRVGLVGSTLSGGLDSSSIVSIGRAVLAARGAAPLRTFSAVFDALPECDERPFIGSVLDGGGLEPHLVCGDDLSPLDSIDETLRRQDEAYGPANLFLHRRLCGAARDAGVRVLLDGLDGDTTVSYGLGYLTELAQAWQWRTFAAETWRLWRRAFGNDRSVLRRLVWQFGLRPLVPTFAQRLRPRVGRPEPITWDPIIRPAFAARLQLRERLAELEHERARAAAEALRGASLQRAAHWRALTSGILSYAMEVLDREAAAFGVRLAFPFMDKRLVEFCLALPASQKLHDGWTRWILRRAMTGVLPDRICWRATKSNLSAVTTRGLAERDRPLIEHVLRRTPAAASQYLDFDALRTAYARLSEAVGRRGYGAPEAGLASVSTWKGVSLTLWLEHVGPTA